MAPARIARSHGAAGHLRNARKDIQARQVEIFRKADRDYGARIEAGLLKASI